VKGSHQNGGAPGFALKIAYRFMHTTVDNNVRLAATKIGFFLVKKSSDENYPRPHRPVRTGWPAEQTHRDHSGSFSASPRSRRGAARCGFCRCPARGLRVPLTAKRMERLFRSAEERRLTVAAIAKPDKKPVLPATHNPDVTPEAACLRYPRAALGVEENWGSAFGES
jgi:hypothetical protein